MNRSTEFERFTQRIYQKLLNNSILKPVRVRHNEKLKGKSGCEHQIDVYWEYEKDGIMHRVAIECKNYDSQVPIGKVRDFHSVLQDLNDVRGIMVSSKGYQKGAKKYADYYSISLKELRVPSPEETIGSVNITLHLDLQNCLYLVDEEWAADNNFDIQGYRERLAFMSYSKSDYWRNATHLCFETKDHFIRDSGGKILTSIDELENQIPKNQESGFSIIFPFEDGWIESRYWGPVKIREVKFEKESMVQTSKFELAAESFVDAILGDAISGKTDYVSKY